MILHRLRFKGPSGMCQNDTTNAILAMFWLFAQVGTVLRCNFRTSCLALARLPPQCDVANLGAPLPEHERMHRVVEACVSSPKGLESEWTIRPTIQVSSKLGYVFIFKGAQRLFDIACSSFTSDYTIKKIFLRFLSRGRRRSGN